MERVWIDSYRVSSYEADLKGDLFLSVLCGFLQETAWHHAHDMGVGYDHLGLKNKIWVLSRLFVKMSTYPRWGEEIRVRTWPKGLHRLFALRDFEITDGEENILGAATTSWLIIDAESRRPQRPDSFFVHVHLRDERDALVDDFLKIPPAEPAARRHEYTVRYSDLDVYGHVNNAKYVEWILNSFDRMRYERQMVDSFKIQYIAECFWGEEISLRLSERGDPPGTCIAGGVKTAAGTGRKTAAGTEIFRAMLSWKPETRQK
jgi:medium-chain acyl-[acyl-carrier-protein] hydrolase